MRLANVAGRAALVVGDGTVDLERASGGAFSADPMEAIARFEELRAIAHELVGPVEPLSAEDLLAPVPRPAQILAVGINYRAHAEEMGLELPTVPATFSKFLSSLTGPEGQVVLPSGNVDYEVELVLVVGKRMEKVAAAEAWSHLAGVMAGQDFSERVVQMAAGRQFSLGKSFPGFAATGPWVTSIDELEDPDDLALGCSIDGRIVQDARTSDMLIPVPELLERLTEVIVLEPGDLVYTGSPSGVGMSYDPPRYLEPGQQLTTWVEGVGEMHHRMVAAR